MATPNHEAVSIPTEDTTINGLLFAPADAGARTDGAALVLIPDVRGIYEHFEDVAGRFAAEGFHVLLIDLYSREGAPEITGVESAIAWMAELSDARVLSDLQAARDFLAARPEIREDRIGITGFCMGGQYTIMAACTLQGFAAAASWYGMLRHAEKTDAKLADPLELVDGLSCPYLGLFGAEDALIPLEQVDELRQKLGRVRPQADVKVYDGAGHAFFNDSRRETFVPDAAADAWPRAVGFFRDTLGAPASQS